MHTDDDHAQEEEQIRYLLMARLTHEYAEKMVAEIQDLVERYPHLRASMPLLNCEQESAQPCTGP